MKSKIVLWGTNEKDEKLLLGIELVAKENEVKIYCIPEALATENFYKEMMDWWRAGQEFEMPEGIKIIDRPLAITESILPDNIKVERTDVIDRAKTEWHFAVLSSKLYDSYKNELEDLKEKIDGLGNFDEGLWEELKGFWGKVQTQIHDKTLFRQQGEKLKKTTNELFDELKKHKKAFLDELNEISKQNADKITSRLKEIEEKIEKGLGLKPLFNDLKNVQSEFKDTELNRKDRNSLWKRIDKAFKSIKQKQYGDSGSSNNSALGRLQNRYNGLMGALGRMKRSLDRDKDELSFQNRRIEKSGGQLETQIRQAKVSMIQQRVDSKQQKYDDMLKIKAELETKIEKEKLKEQKRQEQQEIKTKTKEIDAKIKEQIKEEAESRNVEEEKLKKAAEDIKESKSKKSDNSNILDAVSATLAEGVGDVLDTVKAVSTVVSDKIEDAIEEVKNPNNIEQNDKPRANSEDSLIGAIAATLGESLGNLGDTAKAVANVVGEKIEDVIEDITTETTHPDGTKSTSKANSVLETLGDTVSEGVKSVEKAVKNVSKTVTDKLDKALDDIEAKSEEEE